MNEPKELLELHNKLLKRALCIFPEKGKVNVSTKHGVYIIYEANDKVLHVGRTLYGKGGLDQRLNNHIYKTGVFYREYLKKEKINLRGGCGFRFIEINDSRQRALLEALTAGLLCPKHIGTGVKKQKKKN